MNFKRWDVAGARGGARNVALHLKRVLEAMRGDLPQLAPHRDFLHCLDQNHFRRKSHAFAEKIPPADVSYFTPSNDALQLMCSMMQMRCSSRFSTSFTSRWTTEFWLDCDQTTLILFISACVICNSVCLHLPSLKGWGNSGSVQDFSGDTPAVFKVQLHPNWNQLHAQPAALCKGGRQLSCGSSSSFV